jgi:lipoyl(octanoyl) transferase
MAVADTLILRSLGQVPYDISWQQMQGFTNSRDNQTPDEIWLLEHAPVFTQGQAGKAEHVLNAGDIPVVQADRGGVDQPPSA